MGSWKFDFSKVGCQVVLHSKLSSKLTFEKLCFFQPMGPLYVEALQSSVDANEPELAGVSQDAHDESWRTLCFMSHT